MLSFVSSDWSSYSDSDSDDPDDPDDIILQHRVLIVKI